LNLPEVTAVAEALPAGGRPPVPPMPDLWVVRSWFWENGLGWITMATTHNSRDGAETAVRYAREEGDIVVSICRIPGGAA
jgi:hypothetical protein